MKFTLAWLKDHLDTEASLDEVVDKLEEVFRRHYAQFKREFYEG